MTERYYSEIEAFGVARILGTSALKMLAESHCVEKQRCDLVAHLEQESSEETFANAGANISRVKMTEEELRRKLFPAAMLFQSSMEAKLKLAADTDPDLHLAIMGERYFSPRWLAALVHVNQTADEFEKYADVLYREIRNPVVHLYDDRRADQNLEKINKVSFEAVYTGVRYGWWAYMRLLFGLGMSNADLAGSWVAICRGAGLPCDLFPESEPPARA
ncbi:hypothetical protein [Oceanibium sediminis]|uniref:hypothetical protein n=1 Tax=Oceanibium sediminis TaxID=2026339 RepID=UPI001300289B|nr:hypothetical protein [Oceanibium sediminis]